MPYASGWPAVGIQTSSSKAGLGICTLPHSHLWHYRYTHTDRSSTSTQYCSAYRLVVQLALSDIWLTCTNLCSKTRVRNLWLFTSAMPSLLYHATSFLLLRLLVLRLCNKLNHWKNDDKRNNLDESNKSGSFGDAISVCPTGSFMERRGTRQDRIGNMAVLGGLSGRREGRQYLSQPVPSGNYSLSTENSM